MARLGDFSQYLQERIGRVAEIEQKLLGLQQKYETFYQEVSRVRESELSQLRGHVLDNPAALPADFLTDLRAKEACAREKLAEKIHELEQRQAQIVEASEAIRQASRSDEQKMRGENVELDQEEEALKARSEKLLAEIGAFNGRIGQLARGFGFFVNLFGMRALRRQRLALERAQGELAARIDLLRRKWAEEDQSFQKLETQRRQDWLEGHNRAAALSAKIEHLQAAGALLVQRTTLEEALFSRTPRSGEPGPGDPPCPRCQQKNPAANHFCRICGVRLSADRPDFVGSLEEIAEINLHHQRFSEGMQASQEMIGLVRGLGSGIETFKKSVDGMIQTEKKHPVPKLEIDVPQAAVAWGGHLDELFTTVGEDQSLHPRELAAKLAGLREGVFTEEGIKGYFETMGAELSRCAKEQW